MDLLPLWHHLPAFRVGGGLLILKAAWEMLHGERPSSEGRQSELDALFFAASSVERFLRPSVQMVTSRLLGLLLIAVGVQFIFDGARELWVD